MAFKWNFGNLLRGGKAGKEEEAPLPEEETVKEDSGPSEPSEPPPINWDELVRLPELKGAMIQVWRKCSGPIIPAPVLTLTGGRDPESLNLSEGELPKARLRLVTQMEQDAKRRLHVIEAAEKKLAEETKKYNERMQAALTSGQTFEEAAPPHEPDIDASCHIYTSQDKLLAWLFIFPPMGNGILPEEAASDALQTSGVNTGVDRDALAQAVQMKSYFKLIPVAVGTPPVQGKDGQVIELYPRELEREVIVDDEGRADYRAVNYVQQVEAGDVICRIIPPKEGEAGVRVDGQVVEPKRVSAAKPPRGMNTALTEDGSQLVAAMTGHLEFSNGVFLVRPVLEVRGDVDYSVGNIDFQGDVHIYGDVRENFSVRATGTVMVDGLVEAAMVEAGTDLLITRGVVGDNRALLRCKGNVRVKYLENCVVYAGKGVYADCVMSSQIYSDDVISVISGRGSIIGGTLTAAHSIKALLIGAQSGRRTEITLGILPYVQSEMQASVEELEKIDKESREIDRQLYWLQNSKGQEGFSGKLGKLKMRKSVLAMKEQQIAKRQEKLLAMTVDLSRCRLECETIYPVTALTVQDVTHVINDTKRHFKMAYDVHIGDLVEVF